MKVAYANISWAPGLTAGGFAHVNQFIKTARNLGHEVWTWPDVIHPDCRTLPAIPFTRIQRLRQCEALIFRIEETVPKKFHLLRWGSKQVIGPKKVVWELNTVPEYGRLLGRTGTEVESNIRGFKRFADKCDLAVCVSSLLAKYVESVFGIRNAVVVPNGSDPEIFSPTARPVEESRKFCDFLNVVWLGSAYISWADIDLLIESARRVWNSDIGDKVRFHVVGEGMDSHSNLPPNLYCHGGQTYETVPRWLSFMDVGLVLYKKGPADYSSPLKLFDYMASGLAIISTDQPQASDILRELGQERCVLRDRDPDQIVTILRRFARDPQLLGAYKSISRSLAVEKYTWKHSVAAVFDAIAKA